MYTYNYNFRICSNILVFILGYTYNYMRSYTIIEILGYVQLHEYFYLGTLTLIPVVILFIIVHTYIYMSNYIYLCYK